MGESGAVGAGGGALSGAAAGATVGSVVPGIGTLIGAGVGAAVGGVGGYLAGNALKPPTAPTVAATDPLLQAQLAASQADQVTALQTQASGDTAALMARYGTRLALANSVTGKT